MSDTNEQAVPVAPTAEHVKRLVRRYAIFYADYRAERGFERHDEFVEKLAHVEDAIDALAAAHPTTPAAVPQGWKPIATAPKKVELLVGRFVNDDWRICQSGFYFDAGNEREGEPACWYWCCDWDNGGVTDDEGPTHWMPLPAPPFAAAPAPTSGEAQ